MQKPILSPGRSVRLLITREVWESSLRRLLLDRSQFAVGTVRWRNERASVEILCSDLEVVAEQPSGRVHPPFHDWIVIHVAAEDQLNAHRWSVKCAPRRSQRLAVVVVNGQDKGQWDAAVFDRGQSRQVADLEIVGAGGFSTNGRGEATVADQKARDRASRTIGALGLREFRRLRSSRVTLIGSGRLGSQLAFQLVALGVRHLRLIDPDSLELSNLNAMPGLTVADLGRPKVHALAKRLLAFQPDLLVSCLFASANSQQAKKLLHQRTDLLVTCVDQDVPRLCASIAAKQTLTAHMDVATQVMRNPDNLLDMHADIRLFTPDRDGGCVVCVGGLTDIDQTLYELNAPPGALRRGEPVAWHQLRAGSLVTINSIAVGIAVQTWLDLLSGDLRSSFWHRVRWNPGAAVESNGSPVVAEADCPFCQSGKNLSS